MKAIHQISVPLALVTVLSGCSLPKNMHDSVDVVSKNAERYELDSEDFSEPSRFMYPLTWIEPERRTNNLDKYYVSPPRNTASNVGQAVAITGNVVGALSNMSAAMNFLTLGGSKVTYHEALGVSKLYTVKKFDRNQDWETQANQVVDINVKMLSEALGESAVVEHNGEDFILSEGWKIKDANNPHCEGVTETWPYNLCYSFTSRTPMVNWDNDGYIPWMPVGDVVTARSNLPPGFPIEKLKFASDDEGTEQYLYVAPMKLSPVYDLFKKENMEQTREWYQQERLSVNPYIKRLSDGKIVYFNPRITAQQKGERSLFRVFDFSEQKEK